MIGYTPEYVSMSASNAFAIALTARFAYSSLADKKIDDPESYYVRSDWRGMLSVFAGIIAVFAAGFFAPRIVDSFFLGFLDMDKSLLVVMGFALLFASMLVGLVGLYMMYYRVRDFDSQLVGDGVRTARSVVSTVLAAWLLCVSGSMFALA